MSKSQRDEFIARNLPLVHSLANRFRGRGIEYEELFGAGSLGLVKAYDNFDESRGVCFSTYAVPVILGEIRRLFRDGGSVKMSRSLKELSLKANRAREELSKKGREPTVTEIAEYLGVSPEDAAEAISASAPAVSLTCSDEDGAEFDIPAESEESVTIDKLALRQCLDNLSDEDRKLVILRYFRNFTQSQTAAALGTTQVCVSRRERKILQELRLQLI